MNAEDRQAEIARSLFREANDAFFLFDTRNQRVIDLNPAAMRLTGLAKDEACSLCLGDLFRGDESGNLERLAEAMARTGFFHSREGYLLRCRSNLELPVNLSVSRIHTEPEPIGLVVARDISDRKRIEQTLRQVETRYNSLVASTGVVVWEIDRAGVLCSLGPAFETITGWRGDEWIGHRFERLVHPDDVDAAAGWWQRALACESIPRFEVRIRTRGGSDRTFEFLLVTPIREGQGTRILAISRDVTEHRLLAEALGQAEAMRLAKEDAERASSAKSEFLSSVSHEIRTPLTAILGFADLMAETSLLQEGPAEIREYLDILGQNGRFLLALIDDLLDISRIESRQLRIEQEPCSPRQIVSDVFELFHSRAEARQLSLVMELVGTIPDFIVTDRLRLQQILVNLVDNAIKFTKQGEIRLSTQTSSLPGGEPALEFVVSDTGVGMTADESSHLFEPFYRARPGEIGGPGGTGLGLAICDRLARRLAGNIAFQSSPGEGSRFVLTIPCVPPETTGTRKKPVRIEKEPSMDGGATSPKLAARILLAEDNEANRHVISLRLRMAGAEVLTARNGQEALDLIGESQGNGLPIDAVIMDMQMPILDGYEAVRRLRSDGFTGPIIAVTAYAMREDREECLALGCDEHVSKPLEWDRFLLKLRRLLADRKGSGKA